MAKKQPLSSKSLVTNRAALVAKYGTAGVKKIEEAVDGLIADRQRGLDSRLIDLESASLGNKRVTDATDPVENKAALSGRSRRRCWVGLLASALLTVASTNAVAQRLDECGSVYSPPFAPPGDTGPRTCGKPVARQYTPRHTGLAYRLLDEESEACFVPDSSYQLLDRLVDAVKQRVAAGGLRGRDALATIGMVLAVNGFGLEIPTHTVGDALFNRATGREPERHIFDCDTGSALYMTIAENIGTTLSLVEITLPSGAGHNYVRWNDGGRSVDWDVNGRCECVTPGKVLPHEGKAMTTRQVDGYFRGMVAQVFERQGEAVRALRAYRESAAMYPEPAWAWNNLAWLIATRELPDRQSLRAEAEGAAARAVAIAPTASHLDTQACVHALNGRFSDAVGTQQRVLALAPGNTAFMRRLELFRAARDCTGEK